MLLKDTGHERHPPLPHLNWGPMRIAISGSHRSGKSTLAEELEFRLPDHTTVAEPYELMLGDGYEFVHPPSLEDFESQLERSLELLEADHSNVIFDRCPLDFIGSISTHADAGVFEVEDWLPRVQRVMGTLDLVVFVPIEKDDRIVLAVSDVDGRSREDVDDKLRELLLDDSLQVGNRGAGG